MSQTTPNQKPPSRLKRLLLGVTDESKPRTRRVDNTPASQPAETGYTIRNRLLPVFWTLASVLSLIVNVVLIGILLMLWLRPYDQFSGILGGLYNNFVKMDQATISANIAVQETIPLSINVPVTLTEAKVDIRLTSDAVITGVGVEIIGGPVTVQTGNAKITLPAGTPLSVAINTIATEPINLPVQDQIPISLNVPVNIPLNQTQLHEPFVGLQEVVRPYYCLLEPSATVNGVLVCTAIANPGIVQPTPSLIP